MIDIKSTLRYLQDCGLGDGVAVLRPDESRSIVEHIEQLELAARINRDVIIEARQPSVQSVIDGDPDDDGTTYYSGAHPT